MLQDDGLISIANVSQNRKPEGTATFVGDVICATVFGGTFTATLSTDGESFRESPARRRGLCKIGELFFCKEAKGCGKGWADPSASSGHLPHLPHLPHLRQSGCCSPRWVTGVQE